MERETKVFATYEVETDSNCTNDIYYKDAELFKKKLCNRGEFNSVEECREYLRTFFEEWNRVCWGLSDFFKVC